MCFSNIFVKMLIYSNFKKLRGIFAVIKILLMKLVSLEIALNLKLNIAICVCFLS